MDLPEDLEAWRRNWTETKNRPFHGGEMLTELIAAVNAAVTALGFPRINTPNGRYSAKQLLAQIPKERYVDVVKALCSHGNQSNSNDMSTKTSNKRTFPSGETSLDPTAKKSRSEDAANGSENLKDDNGTETGRTANNIVAVASTPGKRKSVTLPLSTLQQVSKTAAESCSGALGEPVPAEDATESNPVRKSSSRNTTVNLTFPGVVRHYPDIFSDESPFSTDLVAQQFSAEVRKIYPHSLSNLKSPSSSYKIQCAILEKENVGYAVATFVLRDSSPFKPSALVVTLRSLLEH